jgi:hypothetical protein
MSEVEKLKAQLAEAQAKVKALEESKNGPIQYEITDAGYVKVKGLPGLNWQGAYYRPVTWRKLPEILPGLLKFIDANEAEITAKATAWDATKRKQAIG